MPEYLAPGVFIEDIDRGPRLIAGVPTGTAAFLGETERGPTRPRLVTSLSEYSRHFGGDAGEGNFLPYAVGGFFENGGRRAYICRIARPGAIRAALAVGGLRIEALGPGSWGNRIFVRLSESTTTSGPDRKPVGFRLEVAYWNELAAGTSPDPFGDAASMPRPTALEDFDDIVWDDPTSADFYEKRLQEKSALIRVAPAGALSAAPVADFTPLAGGADGAEPTIVEYDGDDEDPNNRAGLAALDLDEYREVALVAAPGASNEIVKGVCEHCERHKFRFAVIDSIRGMGNVGDIDPRSTSETSFAAYYYPWVYTADPQSGTRRLVPPSGHVLGLYVRTDTERGVWKAPANDVLRGILDVEYAVSTAAQEVLNPRGVNTIRQFPGRGLRVWGARTLSANGLWKYVSVRRLFIFLEHSIHDGIQWVVFEPNDERLWTRVRESIRLFLQTQWRNGALMGATEDQAFTIACDRSTMTQDDILNGRMICEIGIAPVRPAEFVVFRIFQNTAEAQ